MTRVTEPSPTPARPASVLDELERRGIVAQTTGSDQLATALGAGPVTFYCGFDPTAPSLHVGNLVQLLTMRRVQLAGNNPIGLVGGATGLIGDPRMSGERVLNPRSAWRGWVGQDPRADRAIPGLRGAVRGPHGEQPGLDRGPHGDRVPAGHRQALPDGPDARQGDGRRPAEGDGGLSFTEFSYQILQGMDFLELFRRYGCTLQTGGNDQWGNLTSGTELIHKVEGATAHALATPLITKADGTKFGKSEGGAIWLDPELTSPYAFYQFWFNTDDRDVRRTCNAVLPPQDEIDALRRATNEGRRHGRRNGRWRANSPRSCTATDAVRSVVDASAALFGRAELDAVSQPTLHAALTEAGLTELDEPMPTVAELLRRTGLTSSLSEARRVVGEGGANINNERVAEADSRARRLIPPARQVPGAAPGKRSVAGSSSGADLPVVARRSLVRPSARLGHGDHQRIALAAAAAERGRPDAAAAPAQLQRQVQRDPRARHPDRVAERDGAAVHVHDALVDAQGPHDEARPRRTPR